MLCRTRTRLPLVIGSILLFRSNTEQWAAMLIVISMSRNTCPKTNNLAKQHHPLADISLSQYTNCCQLNHTVQWVHASGLIPHITLLHLSPHSATEHIGTCILVSIFASIAGMICGSSCCKSCLCKGRNLLVAAIFLVVAGEYWLLAF